MSEVSPGSPGALASRGPEKPPAQLPLRRATIEAAPDKQPAHQVVRLMITGDRPVINIISQHTAGVGTNVTVAGGAAVGSATVTGAHGSAIGGQAASGANTSVTGGQSVQVGRDAVTPGQDAAISGTDGLPSKDGWWARLRKRGAVVALATIIGAISAVAGVVVTILIAAGWKP